MNIPEKTVLKFGKVIIGAQVIRPIKQRAFNEFSPNYVAEPFVKILVERLYQKREVPAEKK